MRACISTNDSRRGTGTSSGRTAPCAIRWRRRRRCRLRARPVAEVALEQAPLDAHPQPEARWRWAWPSPWPARAARRRRPRAAASERGDPLGRRLGLGPALVRQVQARGPAREHLPVVGVRPWRTRRATAGAGGRRAGTPGHRTLSAVRPVGSRPLERPPDHGRDHRLPALPPPGGLARGGGPRATGRLRRPGVLGPSRPRLRRPRGPVAVVGLAPAAHGGNRTGRVFTGDRSGDWLFAALWRAGWPTSRPASPPTTGSTCPAPTCSAAVRCAPPQNKPTPAGARHVPPLSSRRELALLAECGSWWRSASSPTR